MKLIEQLVARGEAADRKAGQIADKEEAAEKRRQAYNSVEREFEAMAADGQLDRGELDKLMAEFRALGLPTNTLEALAKELNGRDGTARVTNDLRHQIGEQLRDAKWEARDPSFAFEAQMLMSEHHQAFDLASRVSKGEHEIYMAAIKHLAC